MRPSEPIGKNARSGGPTLTVPAGAELFGPKRVPQGLYYLRSGHVRLTSTGPMILDHLSSGAYFGEKIFLANTRRMPQTASAITPTRVVLLSRAQLQRQLQADPLLAKRLLKAFSSRLDSYEKRIGDLVTEPADRRLARLLLDLVPPRPGWVRLRFPVTNLEFSQMIGTTRWRISHLLTRFQRLGLLQRRPAISIRRDALQRYLKRVGP